ncbi:hypothetical protein Ddc_06081 [Ditylenchus destructor]|nr:hypothetical protein Ddc_06081 [Ditylenchus destructor]
MTLVLPPNFLPFFYYIEQRYPACVLFLFQSCLSGSPIGFIYQRDIVTIDLTKRDIMEMAKRKRGQNLSYFPIFTKIVAIIAVINHAGIFIERCDGAKPATPHIIPKCPALITPLSDPRIAFGAPPLGIWNDYVKPQIKCAVKKWEVYLLFKHPKKNNAMGAVSYRQIMQNVSRPNPCLNPLAFMALTKGLSTKERLIFSGFENGARGIIKMAMRLYHFVMRL